MRYPLSIQNLISCFRQFSGVGTRTAERYVFSMLDWDPEKIQKMAEAIGKIPEQLVRCSECGCLLDREICQICTSNSRDTTMLCVLSSPRDLYAIEQTKQFFGLYHVIGGLISPLEGRSPEQLGFISLKNRVIRHGIKEVLIAFDGTTDGDATALYIKKTLEDLPVIISRPAYGMPMGSPLEYIDEGTLACALSGRRKL